MQWNELSKKTIGIIIAIGTLFAGTILVIAFVLLRQHGAGTIAGIVQDAVKSQRITSEGEGYRVVSDSLLVTLREGVSGSVLENIADNIKNGIKVRGMVQDQPNTYVVSFPAATVRQLRQLIVLFKESPDVVDASMIPAD